MSDFSELAERDWIRMADYIDCEGCIRIVRGGARSHADRTQSHGAWYGVVLHFTNTDIRMVQWCKDTFGGVVFEQTRRCRKIVYDWRAYNKDVEAILRGCMPHFVSKREQAELAIAFRKTLTSTTRKLAPEVVAQRERMFQRMRELKHEQVAVQ